MIAERSQSTKTKSPTEPIASLRRPRSASACGKVSSTALAVTCVTVPMRLDGSIKETSSLMRDRPRAASQADPARAGDPSCRISLGGHRQGLRKGQSHVQAKIINRPRSRENAYPTGSTAINLRSAPFPPRPVPGSQCRCRSVRQESRSPGCAEQVDPLPIRGRSAPAWPPRRNRQNPPTPAGAA